MPSETISCHFHVPTQQWLLAVQHELTSCETNRCGLYIELVVTPSDGTTNLKKQHVARARKDSTSHSSYHFEEQFHIIII